MRRRQFLGLPAVLAAIAALQGLAIASIMPVDPRLTITMHADTSALVRDLNEIASLLREAGDAREPILKHLGRHIDNGGLVHEIECIGRVSAPGARDMTVDMRIVPGGLLDRVRSALRAGDFEGFR